MRTIVIIVLFIVSSISSFPQIYSGNSREFSTSIVETKPNIFYVSGYTKINTNNGDDILLLKFDLSKNQITSTFIGYKYSDRAFIICKLSNNSILLSGETTGGFNQSYGRENIFFLRINEKLKIKKRKAFYYYARDAALQVKELSDGNILFVGYSRSFDIADKSISDVLLLKTTDKGDTLWHRAFHSEGNDYGMDFLELENENLLILTESGGFRNYNQADYRFSHDADIMFIETDKFGNELQRVYWGGEGHDLARKIIKSPNNDGFYIIGSTQTYGEGNFDILLLKIDDDFNEIWHKTFGSSGIDYGNYFDISADKTRFYVVGTTVNSKTLKPQMTVFSTDLNGNEIWRQDFSINNLTYGLSIVATADNGCAAVGNTGEVYDNYKMFFSKFSENGEYSIIFNTEKQITVYPNPIISGENLNFKIRPVDKEFITNYIFRIYDSTGKLIVNKNDKEFNFEINTSSFQKGLYIYNFIFWDNSVYSGKFIID